jgi:hypothetical protein
MMSQRAGIMDGIDDFDVTTFAPKPAVEKKTEPSADEIRAVSEKVNFRSRESGQPRSATTSSRPRRKHRTGRNIGLNIKASAPTVNLLYDITNQKGWVLGATLEHALAALQRELDRQK